MEGIIYSLLSSSTFPIITAFLLGLLTIISPCPFCSDITAVGYIGKDVSSKATILKNGTLYALGKIITYWGLSFIFILGGDIQPVQHFLEEYGEKLLGPFFLICAILILIFSYLETKHHRCHCGNDHRCHCGDDNKCHCEDGHQCHCGDGHHHNNRIAEKLLKYFPQQSGVGAFVIGLIGSLAFCPYTGVLYFGILIPLTISQSILWSWSLPFSFALATALPVLLITFLFAYGATSIGRINLHVHKIEVYLRLLCVSIFFIVGLYLTVTVHNGHHNHEHHDNHIEDTHIHY